MIVLPQSSRGNPGKGTRSAFGAAAGLGRRLFGSLLLPGSFTPQRLWSFGLLALMAIALCAGERGIIRLIGLKIECASIRREIRELSVHRDELRRDLAKYTGDPETIERAAREKLDLIRRGETVYKFPPGS